MGMPASFDQAAFAGFCDDGTDETDSTGKETDGSCGATEAEATDRNWTQDWDENFLVRFVALEDSATAEEDIAIQLEWENNTADPGVWTAVNGSSLTVRSFASTKLTDGSDTTQRIGSGTFLTTNAGQDDVDGLAGGLALDYAGSDECEVVFCVQIRSADVSDGDVIQLRLSEGGAVFATLTSVPAITVNDPTPPAGGDPLLGGLALLGVGK